MKIELIIFDCDGVLVNSEPISNKVFAQMLNEIKIKIDEEETTQLFKGRSMESCRQIVNSEFNKNISDSFLKECPMLTISLTNSISFSSSSSTLLLSDLGQSSRCTDSLTPKLYHSFSDMNGMNGASSRSTVVSTFQNVL